MLFPATVHVCILSELVPSHANCATRLCVFMVGLSDLTTGMYLVFCLLVEFMVKCSYKLIHVLAALLLS